MDLLIEYIQSPLGLIITAVLTGILANFVTRPLQKIWDKIFDKGSSWLDARNEQLRIHRNEMIKKLRSDYHEQYRLAFDDLRIRFRSMTMIIVGSIFFPLALILKENNSRILFMALAIIGILFVMFGVKDYLGATAIRNLILEASSDDGDK